MTSGTDAGARVEIDARKEISSRSKLIQLSHPFITLEWRDDTDFSSRSRQPLSHAEQIGIAVRINMDPYMDFHMAQAGLEKETAQPSPRPPVCISLITVEANVRLVKSRSG